MKESDRESEDSDSVLEVNPVQVTKPDPPKKPAVNRPEPTKKGAAARDKGKSSNSGQVGAERAPAERFR